MMDFSSSSLHIFSDFSLFFSLFFLSLALTAVVCVANALLMLMSPLFSGRSVYVFDTHTRTNHSTLTSLKVPFKLGKKLFCSCKSWIKHGTKSLKEPQHSQKPMFSKFMSQLSRHDSYVMDVNRTLDVIKPFVSLYW